MRPRRLPGISASSDLRDGFRGGRQPRPRGVLYIAAFHLLLGRVYDDKDVQERIVRRSKKQRRLGDRASRTSEVLHLPAQQLLFYG
jgi:hypothetical protein